MGDIITFHVYEDDNTKEYIQEWEIQVHHYKLKYYAYNTMDVEQVKEKVARITRAMNYVTSVTNMNTMVPRLIWQDDF
jgi:hypothetical protein